MLITLALLPQVPGVASHGPLTPNLLKVAFGHHNDHDDFADYDDHNDHDDCADPVDYDENDDHNDQ